MRRHSLMQRAFIPGFARARPPAVLGALALAAVLGSAACSDYDGTDRWPDVYLPESEIDRPKGGVAAMDAGRPDGGADAATSDGASGDAASNGDAAPADAAPADAAPDDAASNVDAAPDDAASGDAGPADAAAEAG